MTIGATRHVSLALNDRVVETKSVDVPEGGRATVEFQSLDVPYGRNKGAVKIDAAYVHKHVGDLAKNTDLSRFIL